MAEYIYPPAYGRSWAGPKIWCEQCQDSDWPRKDKHLVAHYTAEFTACGCATHVFMGIDCVPVERKVMGRRIVRRRYRRGRQGGKRKGTHVIECRQKVIECRCTYCDRRWEESDVPLQAGARRRVGNAE